LNRANPRRKSSTIPKAGWSWVCVSEVDSYGRTIWIVDAHRSDGKRFVVRADEKLTAFMELQLAIRCYHLWQRPNWIILFSSSASDSHFATNDSIASLDDIGYPHTFSCSRLLLLSARIYGDTHLSTYRQRSFMFLILLLQKLSADRAVVPPHVRISLSK
jgi:hypothetical protein